MPQEYEFSFKTVECEAEIRIKLQNSGMYCRKTNSGVKQRNISQKKRIEWKKRGMGGRNANSVENQRNVR